MKVRVIIAGSNGRMGQKLVELAEKSDDFDVVATTTHHDDMPDVKADVLIDFTHPSALSKHLKYCVKNEVALVLGTTGLSKADEAAVEKAAKNIPVVCSANFSIGVNIMVQMAEKLARVLDDSFDIEIAEAHHKHKKDAPGGTALMLGRAAAKGRNIDFDKKAVLSRVGETGPRETGDIGYSVIRGGEIIGEHTVMYIGDNEHIEISHKARDRALFAQGALTAAKWTKGQSNDIYSMTDILDIN